MQLEHTETGFILTGSAEDLERLQSTAHYAKQHLQHKINVAWVEDRPALQRIQDCILGLENVLS